MKNQQLHLNNLRGFIRFVSLFVTAGATNTFSQTLFDDGNLKYVIFENTSNKGGVLVLVTGLTDKKQLQKDLIIPDEINLDGETYAVNGIMPYAFAECTNLVSASIPNAITSIGDGTFFDCANLRSVTIPNTVTIIGKHTFYGCTGLTTIIIPDSIIKIDNAAFKNCSGLTSVIIPKLSNCVKPCAAWVG